MNIYINPELYKDDIYGRHLKKAEAFSEDIFNKEKILAFSDAHDLLSEENKELIVKACDEIAGDADYRTLCHAMLYFMQNSLPIELLRPPKDGGLKAEFALFFPVWYMAEKFMEDAKKRGVSCEIIRNTLLAIDSCITRNAGFEGQRGTGAYHFWLPLYGQGKLFRMADFEFELRKYAGKDAIGVHIPKGTKLDVEKNLKSFKTALDFFRKHYAEYEITGFVCESWLLNPHIEEIMGRKTNISRFGDMFERFDIGDTDGTSVYRFVFGLTKPVEVSQLCEDTSLQRNLKAYFKTGKRVTNYGGFLSAEKLNDM